MVFLGFFTYTVLVRMKATPSWQEVYSIAYITTLGCEKLREIVSSEPVAIRYVYLDTFVPFNVAKVFPHHKFQILQCLIHSIENA